jgi:hypothetical protein
MDGYCLHQHTTEPWISPIQASIYIPGCCDQSYAQPENALWEGGKSFTVPLVLFQEHSLPITLQYIETKGNKSSNCYFEIICLGTVQPLIINRN